MGELIKAHEQLTEITVAIYLDYFFPEGSELVHATILRDEAESPDIALYHSFRFADWRADSDVNELVFSAGFSIRGDLCSVEPAVKVYLGRAMGEFDSEMTVLFSEYWEGADFREGLAFLDASVRRMAAFSDAPRRLGFDQRR